MWRVFGTTAGERRERDDRCEKMREAGLLFGGHPLGQGRQDIQGHEQFVLHAVHAGEEASVAVLRIRGERFTVIQIDRHHVGDAIDQQADDFVSRGDDDHPGARADLGRPHFQHGPQVDHRDDGATQIHDAANHGRGVGNGGDFADAKDFAHRFDGDAEQAVANRNVMSCRFGPVVEAVGAS